MKKTFLALSLLITIIAASNTASNTTRNEIEERKSWSNTNIANVSQTSLIIGGSGSEAGESVAFDSYGNMILVGYTSSSNFPTLNAFDDSFNGPGDDCFITKIAPNGAILWSTFLGWIEHDHGRAVIVDSHDDIFIAGGTDSVTLLSNEVFLAKVSSAGSLEWITFVNGSASDLAIDMATDNQENIIVFGATESSDFPTLNASDATHNGNFDAFVTKFNSTGSVLWSTFLGGSGLEEVWEGSMAVDFQGNVFVTGNTASTDFPTVGAYPSGHSGGSWDTFLSKFWANGTLAWSTYLGGSQDDRSGGVSVDSKGNVIVTGETWSSDIPLKDAYISSRPGDWNAFVSKFSPEGALLWSTFLGGSNSDGGKEACVDSLDNVIIIGFTSSTDFPGSEVFATSLNGGSDLFISKFTPNGSLLWSVYLGGKDTEEVRGATINAQDSIALTGYTSSPDYPATIPGKIPPGPPNYNYTNDYNDVFLSYLPWDFDSPSIILNSPPNSSIHPSGTLMDLDITDLTSAINQVLYNWDGATNATVSSPYDIPLPIGEGVHVLNAYAEDLAGNWATQTFSFVTDDLAPTILLNSTTNGSVQSPGVTIEFDVTDATNVTQVRFSWDNAANTTLSAPYRVLLPSSPGSHVLRVYATDPFDHWASETFQFNISEASPPTSSSSGSPPPTNSAIVSDDSTQSTVFVAGFLILAVSGLGFVKMRRKRI